MNAWLIRKDGWCRRHECNVNQHYIVCHELPEGVTWVQGAPPSHNEMNTIERRYYRRQWQFDPHEFLRPGEIYFEEQA